MWVFCFLLYLINQAIKKWQEKLVNINNWANLYFIQVEDENEKKLSVLSVAGDFLKIIQILTEFSLP